MERLGLQFPVSEFEPQIPDSTTFDGIWEFQRHGISRGLGLQFRNSRISIPSPPLHCRLTSDQRRQTSPKTSPVDTSAIVPKCVPLDVLPTVVRLGRQKSNWILSAFRPTQRCSGLPLYYYLLGINKPSIDAIVNADQASEHASLQLGQVASRSVRARLGPEGVRRA